jgi:hypothetical protein
MFCLWLVLPCLAFTFFFSPYDHEIMTHMPGEGVWVLKKCKDTKEME